MAYIHKRTGRTISTSDYYDLESWEQDSYVRQSSSSNSGSVITSAIIGAATDSALLGGLLGGSIVGGIIGDSLDGDLWD